MRENKQIETVDDLILDMVKRFGFDILAGLWSGERAV
jgi:hypothetical protein